MLVFLVCFATLLFGRLEALSLTNVVRVTVNVGSGSASCFDWFEGTANTEYLAALATYNIGQSPAVSCQQVANVVHQVELLSAEPGANILFDDPRKVPEAVVELRNKEVINRVSIYVDFFYTAPDASTAKDMWSILNENIRSGDFLGKVENASVPLLMAKVNQEVFDGGIACPASAE